MIDKTKYKIIEVVESSAITANEVFTDNQIITFYNDSSKIKITDGKTKFNDLPFVGASGNNSSVATTQEALSASNTVTDGDSLTAGLLGATPWPSALSTNTGLKIINKAIAGQTSSEAKTRFDASPETYKYNRIIWLGRNDFSINASTASATIKANIAAMISAIGHDRYIVFGVTNKADEPIGNATYNAILAHNTDLATLYPGKYFDPRSFLLTQGNNSTQDNADIANGLIPTSLRADNTHFNSLANSKIAIQVAPLLTAMIGTLGAKTISVEALALSDGSKLQEDVAANGSYSIGGIPVLKLPNQEIYSGSLLIGNTGTKLSNLSGTTPGQSNLLIIGGNEVTTGYSNTALSKFALGNLTTGNSNTAVGPGSLAALTTTQRNSAFGAGALASNTGNQNTAGGFNAGFGVLGDDNALFGNQVATNATSRNSIFGARAGFGMTAGASNCTFIGYQVADNATFASKCIAIGHDIDLPSASTNNQMVIGNIIFGINVSGTGTTIAGQIGIGKQAVATSILSLPASTTGISSLNIAGGVAPTAPVNGDIWSDGTNLFIRLAGVTKTIAFV